MPLVSAKCTQYPKVEACVMEYYNFMYKRIKVR